MLITVESLKAQLIATEAEFEQARAHLYRCDGAVQIIKHLLAEAEKPENPVEESTENPASA